MQAVRTLPKAALSPPAAKNMPQAMNAVGRIRWKFLGSERPMPRSPSVTQWNVKLSENSVQRNERTPITSASGKIAFARGPIESTP